MRNDVLMLLASVSLCFAVAFVASRFEPGMWYKDLAKPGWTPPSWVFGPVWTALYAMMGVAAWLVWRQAGLAEAALPLTFFVMQLFFNGMWSWIFFGRQNIGLAFAEIVLLWILILVTMVLFWKRQTMAGALFLPYFLWVSFAAVLNYAIWRLNS